MKMNLCLGKLATSGLALSVLICGLLKTANCHQLATNNGSKKDEVSFQDGTSLTDSQDPDKTTEPFLVKVPEGGIQFTVSGSWKKVKPSNNIIDVEIKMPRLEPEQQDGRLTISGARGTIEANISRWEGQFSTKSVEPKTETKTIADLKVHLVDLAGTYVDAPGGPFSGAPTIERENYRMLGAIIQTPAKGNYFVKFYGPKAVIDKNEKEFKQMIQSLEVLD